MRKEDKLLVRSGTRKTRYRKPFAIWIGYVLIVEVVGNLLLKKGIEIPMLVESILVLTVFVPPAIVLLRAFRNKNVKPISRAISVIFFLTICIALLGAAVLPLFGV